MFKEVKQVYKGATCQKDKKLESLIRKGLYDFKMLDADDKTVGLAMSGGKDSTTLACILASISGKGFCQYKIHAFMVTGPFSCGPSLEIQGAKELCKSLGIQLTLIDSGQKKLTNCYNCSRARRSLIFKAAKKEGIEKVFFGHHRDDSIETLLMNMLHKAELCANLAKVTMHKFGITILRPMIYVSEKEIVNFSKRHGFLKIVCQCPIGTRSKRRQAKDLLDLLQQQYPNVRKNLSLIAHKHGEQKALKI